MAQIIQMSINFGYSELTPTMLQRPGNNQPTVHPNLDLDYMSHEEYLDCCAKCDLRELCSADECGAHLYPLDSNEPLNWIEENEWWAKYGVQPLH